LTTSEFVVQEPYPKLTLFKDEEPPASFLKDMGVIAKLSDGQLENLFSTIIDLEVLDALGKICEQLADVMKVTKEDARAALRFTTFVLNRAFVEDLELEQIRTDLAKLKLPRLEHFIDLIQDRREQLRIVMICTTSLVSIVPSWESVDYTLDERIVVDKETKVLKRIPVALAQIVAREPDKGETKFRFQSTARELEALIDAFSAIRDELNKAKAK
jgi:hypothetical protein